MPGATDAQTPRLSARPEAAPLEFRELARKRVKEFEAAELLADDE